MSAFSSGWLAGIITFLFLISVFPKTKNYHKGVEETHKEAFENGLMKKEVDIDGKITYRWIELHKVGYEDN